MTEFTSYPQSYPQILWTNKFDKNQYLIFFVTHAQIIQLTHRTIIFLVSELKRSFRQEYKISEFDITAILITEGSEHVCLCYSPLKMG